jgi:hypothetical protein
MSDFRLLMLSAMNENGGNTTHRLLDGHPELWTYPYESQVGTKYSNDFLSSMFPAKYRWPTFPTDANPEDYYEMIIDEETKILLRTPHVSKFRDAGMEMAESDRRRYFVEVLGERRSRGAIMEAFFVATHRAWTNCSRSGQERTYVGYNPIIVVDAAAIIEDLAPNGFVLHVVRNPFSAYADRKKRPTRQSVAHYTLSWQICLQEALYCQRKYPKHCFVLRYEDIIEDPPAALTPMLETMGHSASDTLQKPSWNGRELPQVYPWGTIRIPTAEVNLATARELPVEERREIQDRLGVWLEHMNYVEFANKI